ncbi:hypothetical protein HXX76_015610 [Chlamydomonas incerta]|uniref:Apple domain-containing protein n=1 Tax=Chlamydomonas incerta TaxID=51695 RepID=A0A835VN61_CHLIN|nr:hypothetical protein HXX76_015610 [Chlamydomonas incerta]|eukprot:KAG2423012.1 hypothetical protein HXX76_015610 [Chlamydomonas incerta]
MLLPAPPTAADTRCEYYVFRSSAIGFTCSPKYYSFVDYTNTSGRLLAAVPGVSTYAACLALCDERPACMFAVYTTDASSATCYLATAWMDGGGSYYPSYFSISCFKANYGPAPPRPPPPPPAPPPLPPVPPSPRPPSPRPPSPKPPSPPSPRPPSPPLPPTPSPPPVGVSCQTDANILGYELQYLNTSDANCRNTCLGTPACTYYVTTPSGYCSIRYRFIDSSGSPAPGTVLTGTTAPFASPYTSCFLRSTIGVYLCSTPGSGNAVPFNPTTTFPSVFLSSLAACQDYCSSNPLCRLFSFDEQGVIGAGQGNCQAARSWDFISSVYGIVVGGADTTCAKVYP